MIVAKVSILIIWDFTTRRQYMFNFDCERRDERYKGASKYIRKGFEDLCQNDLHLECTPYEEIRAAQEVRVFYSHRGEEVGVTKMDLQRKLYCVMYDIAKNQLNLGRICAKILDEYKDKRVTDRKLREI